MKTKYYFRSPQLEYTRFPWAANEPPRATLCGVSSRPFLPQESRIFQLLGWFFIHKGLLYYFDSSESTSFHKHFNLFIIRNIRCISVYYSLIRSTTSLIGTESVRLQWKSTVLAPIQIVRIYIHTLNDETDSNIYTGKASGMFH